MKQYIDKAVVAAEMSKWLTRYKKLLMDIDKTIYDNIDSISMLESKIDVLHSVYHYLDTLEVKEVDLEKEIDRYCESIQAWPIQEAPYTSIEKCAHHFYELGLKAQKGK